MTLAFKIIKEKIIQSCFKTFMGRIEFKFVLFLFYPTPLYTAPYKNPAVFRFSSQLLNASTFTFHKPDKHS